MEVTPLPLSGLLLVKLRLFRDTRGFFVERFQADAFQKHGLPIHFAQDNHSRSLPGVLRGLHYQANPGQGKLVGVVRGSIWDVVVDLRASSTTFGQSFGIELSDDNGLELWVPQGFGHGFCVLGDGSADVVYKVDTPYQPAGEGGIHWADSKLNIRWPITNPTVSTRDNELRSFADYCKRPVF